MIRIFLLFVLPFSLYASKILSYNIYDRSDRVDVMITFDTPYDGVIKQSIGQSTIAIKLQDAYIESSKQKSLSSKYLKTLSITPMAEYTKIIAEVPKSTILKASKTADSYGLRLRFTAKEVPSKNSSAKQDPVSPFANLPTKKSDDIEQSYYIVIAILIIGIVILFYIKKRVTPLRGSKKEKSSWLFKETSDEEAESKSTSYKIDQEKNTHSSSDIKIRFQKPINDTNSVIMLDFAEQSYLVLIGKNNLLLDKFLDNKPQTEDDFNTILQERHKELDDFLRNDTIQEDYSEPKEALRAYKERAAAIVYEN